MVKINGNSCDSVIGINLHDYLMSASFDHRRIAVEINGIIIPKNQYESTIIEDGDNIEIVNFVGGG